MHDDRDAAIIVALGSNIGFGVDPPVTIVEKAFDQFPKSGLKVKRRSRLWRSSAWPDPADPPFVNAVAWIVTDADPADLMQRLLTLEHTFGRHRHTPNAPRTLDLDLIAHGRSVANEPSLVLPHPRAHERLFVMGPLAEILPEWRHPSSGDTAGELAARTIVGPDARPL